MRAPPLSRSGARAGRAARSSERDFTVPGGMPSAVGGLGEAAALEVELLQHAAVVLRRLVQGLQDGDRRHHPVGVVALDGGGAPDPPATSCGRAAARPDPVGDEVADDGQQPAAGGAPAVGQHLRVAPRPDQRLLHDVLGRGPVADQPRGVGQQGPAVLGVDGVDQRLVDRPLAPHAPPRGSPRGDPRKRR